MTLAPGAYCAIAVSPDGAAGFGVSLSGETLLLSDAQGQVRDVFRTGALQSGRTSGRTAAAPGAARVFFSAPTRGRANSASFTTGRTPAPTFSETALYRDGPFLLTLSCADADAAIRYTLDGSEPGPDDALYAGPIQIDASVTVRAAAFGAGLEPSPVQTQHYLFEPAHTLPVVCIACEPALWSRLMRSTLNAVAREGPAAISYYEADGTLGTVFPAAIRARGNTSLKYAQKSVSVHLRPSLGQRTVTYPFWGAGSAAAYGTLVLRNASQDIAAARLRDSFANRAAAGLRLDCAATRPVVVYVNGAYHGVYDLNEGMNQDYLEAHYGVDPDTVNIVGKNAVTRHGSAADYARVRRYARGTDFADDAALEAFGAWVDVAHVTDYLIAQTFFGNYDIHNQNCWASDDYAIRWRPYLYDVDRCLCPGRSELNLFEQYFNAQAWRTTPRRPREHGYLLRAAGKRGLAGRLFGPLRAAAVQRFLRRSAHGAAGRNGGGAAAGDGAPHRALGPARVACGLGGGRGGHARGDPAAPCGHPAAAAAGVRPDAGRVGGVSGPPRRRLTRRAFSRRAPSAAPFHAEPLTAAPFLRPAP